MRTVSVLSPVVSAFGEDPLIIGMNRWDDNSVQKAMMVQGT